MNLQRNQLKSRLQHLEGSLAGYSTGNRDLLFEARSAVQFAGEDLSKGAWKHLVPAIEIIESMIDDILRLGGVTEEKTIELSAKLLHLVVEGLDRPAPGLLADTTVMPRLQLVPDHSATSEEEEPEAELQDEPQPQPTAGAAPVQPAPGPTPEANLEPSPEVEPEAEGTKRWTAAPVAFSYDLLNESRLGEILIRTGRIAAEDLDRALVVQRLQPGRLGTVLVSMGIIEEASLREALEDQRNVTLELADGLSATEMTERSGGEAERDSYDDLSAAS
ncbi:MAG: hypothetical protein GY711_34465 [bacterium]|nr:hypothetical protein [bacterium]